MTANEYREFLTRYLKMKRDMPWNSEPEPEPGYFTEDLIPGLDWAADKLIELTRATQHRIRREVIADFNRTT